MNQDFDISKDMKALEEGLEQIRVGMIRVEEAKRNLHAASDKVNGVHTDLIYLQHSMVSLQATLRSEALAEVIPLVDTPVARQVAQINGLDLASWHWAPRGLRHQHTMPNLKEDTSAGPST